MDDFFQYAFLQRALLMALLGGSVCGAMGVFVVLWRMGYTRMAHFIAGFVLIISTVLRYIYGLVWGNRYSRELIIVPVWSKDWWNDLWQDVRWYLFLNKECAAHVGHNPLAQLGMGTGMIFMLVIMLTGLGMYAQDSHVPFIHFFTFVQDWINNWFGGNGQMTRSLHRLGMPVWYRT